MQSGIPGPEQVTRVVIVKDGSDLTVNGVRVRAVRNSHFDDGSPEDLVSQSLSYRYDYKGYGIGYTGDTGPSDAVTRLEKGADLLVSEVADVPAIVAMYTNSTLSPEEKSANIHHFAMQHLSPHEAGKIAEGAGVRLLVLSHLVLRGTNNAEATKFISEAHETFKGVVIFAQDLDRF
jgi:ribonuclease BN (tRNA processing enzyme)